MVEEETKKTGDEPIRSPEAVGPEYVWEPDKESPESIMLNFGRKVYDSFRKPAHWIRENIVEANRGPKYYWYHKKFKRALPIDECYMDDIACQYEANLEYKRMHLVDRATLDLLRYRRDTCYFWNLTTKGYKKYPSENCQDLADTFEREELNYFIKYREMTYNATVAHAFNKQKHRMIMERRRALAEQKEVEKLAAAADEKEQ